MGSSAQPAATEAPPTRRQIAARKRAARDQAAKAWLATRKNSATPVADRLMAGFLSEFSAEAIAYGHQKLQRCLIKHVQASNWGPEAHYPRDASALCHEFAHWKISTPSKRAQDAIDYLKEQGMAVSEKEAQSCLNFDAMSRYGLTVEELAAEKNAAKEAKARRQAKHAEPAPMIEADEPAPARLERNLYRHLHCNQQSGIAS